MSFFILVSPLLPTMTPESKRPPAVAVIGAGMAGMAAAVTLQDHGLRPVVFEASREVGGRMHSTDSAWQGPHFSEWCAELINSDHEVLLGFVRRLGIPLMDRAKAREVEPSNGLYLIEGEIYAEADAAADYGRIADLVDRQARTLGLPGNWNLDSAAARELDGLSAYEWIEAHVPGGHDSKLGKLLDLGYTIDCGVDTRRQGAINIVRRVRGQSSSSRFSVLGAHDERYSVIGGVQQVPRGLALLLPTAAIHLGCRLRALAKLPGGQAALTIERDGEDKQLEFDQVILTLPYSALREVDYSAAGLEDGTRRAIEEFGYGCHTKLQLEFSSRPWRHGENACDGTIFSDYVFQATWEASLGRNEKTAILVVYIGGPPAQGLQLPSPYATVEDPRVAEVAAQMVDALDQIWPGIADAYLGRATMTSPSSAEYLRGSYSCRLVGQYTAFDGREAATQGPFVFAGEHTPIIRQQVMDGAARAGVRAAQEVLGRT